MFTLIVFLSTILFNIFVIADNSCNQRDYGKGGTVCVCNVTHCDSFEPIIKTNPGVITRYESSKSGKRFDKNLFKFTNNTLEMYENSGKTVTINRKTKYQKILGFGGAFTDAAAINILSLDFVMSRRIISDYYSSNGLSYSMGRIPMAGSDFSSRKYTYDDFTDDLELKHFKLSDEDLKFKIPLLKLAQNFSPNLKLFASPWSAPAWMKTNNDLAGKGSLKGGPGGPYYKAWAQYFVKFLDAYKNQSINIWGLTAQNEPNDGEIPSFGFNCMGFTDQQQRDFIAKDLGPALKAANYGKDRLSLMIFDDQRPYLNKWSNTILKDNSSAQFVSGIAFHWYLNSVSSPKELDKTHEEFPNFFLLSTEACEGSNPFQKDRVSLGSWDRAETYAFDIITDLQHFTSGWIDWNLALDVRGGPNWANNFVDAPIIVNSTAKEYYKQPMYYSLAHFSKFLAPDSQRIETNNSGVNILETVAFETQNKGTVLIALNRLNDTIPLTIIDPSFGYLKTNVSPHSIQSYVWYQ